LSITLRQSKLVCLQLIYALISVKLVNILHAELTDKVIYASAF